MARSKKRELDQRTAFIATLEHTASVTKACETAKAPRRTGALTRNHRMPTRHGRRMTLGRSFGQIDFQRLACSIAGRGMEGSQ